MGGEVDGRVRGMGGIGGLGWGSGVGCLALGFGIGGVWVACGYGLDGSTMIGIGAGIGECIGMTVVSYFSMKEEKHKY